MDSPTRPFNCPVIPLDFTETSRSAVQHPAVAFVEAHKCSEDAANTDIENSSVTKAIVCPSQKKQLDDISLSLQDHMTNLDSPDPSVYFIVKGTWWKEWILYANQIVNEIPNPINNEDVIKDLFKDSPDPSKCAFSLKDDVKIEFADVTGYNPANCIALPYVTWMALSSWFGGGPPIIYRGLLRSRGNKVVLDVIRSRSFAAVDVDLQTGKILVLGVPAAPAGDKPLAEDGLPSTGAQPGPTANHSTGTTGHCFVCGDVSKSRCSRCSKVFYCSSLCQKAHWRYHKTWCTKQGSAAPVGKRGNVGFINTGNSCYLNSSVQCLTHCLPLTKLFLGDKYIRYVNATNKDGSGQNAILVREYDQLLKDMWFDNRGLCSPSRIKAVLGSINRDYMGNLQQDAHDVLELLLDRIHEDLNRVTTKPYTEQPEGDGSNDAQISEEAWSKHRLRHDSVITDMFGGQFKSTVSCCSKDCKRVSVTFDYFNTLQLAIPGPMSHVMMLYMPNIQV